MTTNLEFVRLMFSDAPDGAHPWVASFHSAPADATRSDWCGWPVRRVADVPGADAGNTYCVVSTFRPDENGRIRRRKAQFASMHAVMIDDIATKVAEQAIALPFTVMIETSPGNFQGWMKLDPPITDRELAERLVDRMVAAGLAADGRDPGMKGVTRYGRLPQGTNTKPRSSGPWRHLVAEVRPALTYTAEEIAEAYGLDLTPPPPRLVRAAPAGPLPDVLAWLRALGLYQGQLGDGWHSIVCPWVNEHTGQVPTGTAYREPAPENNYAGAFKCHHGHCEHRNVGALFRFLDAIAEEVRT